VRPPKSPSPFPSSQSHHSSSSSTHPFCSPPSPFAATYLSTRNLFIYLLFFTLATRAAGPNADHRHHRHLIISPSCRNVWRRTT
jgi:hypothetical protein